MSFFNPFASNQQTAVVQIPSIRKYKPSILPEDIEPMELAVFPGKIKVITKEGRDYKHAIKHLKEQRFIGFDTETKPTFQPHMPRPHTALLQLSSESEAFLFRLHDLGLPDDLAAIMADPYITKIGAAVGDDIRGLQYYNRFEAQRFMDLQRLGEEYGIQDKSVRKMSAIILGLKVSKAQQCSNWEAGELSDAQQQYAATDAWICLRMYKALLASERVGKQELKNE
ncbi:MAG: 3'-5' exonuclease domain-containing protein 2 [Bacteroidales bacterium]|nr:3'-5' exonuclease domain-containing protein 2 [Candidatus Cacconaster merdequi]